MHTDGRSARQRAPLGGVCGRSSTRGEEVLAADHEAPAHVAEDRSLVFRKRVYEHGNTDLCGPARLRDFARFARAKQCPPRQRQRHLGRTAVRDTPPTGRRSCCPGWAGSPFQQRNSGAKVVWCGSYSPTSRCPTSRPQLPKPAPATSQRGWSTWSCIPATTALATAIGPTLRQLFPPAPAPKTTR